MDGFDVWSQRTSYCNWHCSKSTLWCSMVRRHPPRSRLAPAGTVSRHQMSPAIQSLTALTAGGRTTCGGTTQDLQPVKPFCGFTFGWRFKKRWAESEIVDHKIISIALRFIAGPCITIRDWDLLHTLSPINEVISLQLPTEKCQRDVTWSNWISPRVIEHPQFQGIGSPPQKKK